MLRKKVLSVSPNKATLLVEESASGTLKVLRRVNIATWAADELEEAQRLYGVLGQSSIPVISQTENVVFQSAYLNVVSPYFPNGELAQHIRSTPQNPPSDAQVARWLHVIALGVQSVHRLGFVHAALRLSKVYLTEECGAAGIVLGSPQPLPLYREALEEAKGRHSSGLNSSESLSPGGGPGQHIKQRGANNASVYSNNISVNSLELNYPPEVLGPTFRYTAASDVWHLGAMLMAVSAAHGQLQSRGDVLQELINDMCHDDPQQRVSVEEVIRRLVHVHQKQTSTDRATSSSQKSIASGGPHHNPPASRRIDEGDDGHDGLVRSSVSPDPLDPHLATQRYTPPPPLVFKKTDDASAVQPSNAGIVLTPRRQRGGPPPSQRLASARQQASVAGLTAPQQQRGGRTGGTPTRAHSRPVTQRATGVTAVRQAQNATSAYLTHAFEQQEAELQRRRDEQARELARKRDAQLRGREEAEAVHRQHIGNMRRIVQQKGTLHHHREDIRKSIRQWQHQQQLLLSNPSGTAGGEGGNDETTATGSDEENAPEHTPGRLAAAQHHASTGGGGVVLNDGCGVVVFATAEAPPSTQQQQQPLNDASSRRHSSSSTTTKDARNIAGRTAVGPSRSVADDLLDVGDETNYVVGISPKRTLKPLQTTTTPAAVSTLLHGDQSHSRLSQAAVASQKLSSTLPPAASSSSSADSPTHQESTGARATAFEITPPRKRRQQAAAAGPSADADTTTPLAPPVAGGVLPFAHHKGAQLAKSSGSSKYRDPLAEDREADVHRSQSGTGEEPAAAHLINGPITSDNTLPQSAAVPPPVANRSSVESHHVSSTAALEWSSETLRRSITQGPWMALAFGRLVAQRLLRLVDRFARKAPQARLQLKDNAQLFEQVRRIVIDGRDAVDVDGHHHLQTLPGDDDCGDDALDKSRREGLFSVLAPLVCQLVAIEGTLALSEELRSAKY